MKIFSCLWAAFWIAWASGAPAQELTPTAGQETTDQGVSQVESTGQAVHPVLVPPLVNGGSPTDTHPSQPVSPSSSETKLEFNLMAGGDFNFSSNNPIPGNSAGPTNIWGGDYGVGFDGGLALYLPVDSTNSNMLIGVNFNLNFSGVNVISNSDNDPNPSVDVTEKSSLVNAELAAAMKIYLGGRDIRPYFLTGFGADILSTSSSVTATTRSFGSNSVTSVTLPANTTYNPMAQLGWGLNFPAGDDIGSYFIEARCNLIFILSADQTLNLNGTDNLSFRSPAYTATDTFLDVGVCFNLK